MTGWFTLQSMEKQSEIARVSACYGFQAERARLALQKLDSLNEAEKKTALVSHKAMDMMKKKISELQLDELENYTNDAINAGLDLKTQLANFGLYASADMSKKIEQVNRQLTNLIRAVKSEKSELIFKAVSDLRAEDDGLKDMLKKEMELLRDPFAQCN